MFSLAYLAYFCLFYYSGMIIWFIIGNIMPKKKPPAVTLPSVSIIVAIRNGASSLPNLIKGLSKQTYLGKMEFILIDDQSEDETDLLINQAVNIDRRFKYVSSKGGNPKLNHKKRALDAGINHAQYEWLLFTDVDCRIKPTWVEFIAKYFSECMDYVIGFSQVKPGNQLVSCFQSLDYLMLMICARGATNLGHAWASSGQNQAYRRSLFYSVNGFTKISEELQGDDSLFLQLCRKKNIKIAFADDPESRIIARQETSWLSFLKQRIRWSGDARIMWKFNIYFF